MLDLRRTLVLTLIAGLLGCLGTAPAGADSLIRDRHVVDLTDYADLVVDREHDRVYVSAGWDAGDRIAIVDHAGNPVGMIDGAPDAHQMALTPDGDALYVASGWSTVLRFDTTTLRETARFTLADGVHDLAVVGGRIWYAGGTASAAEGVHSYDLATGRDRHHSRWIGSNWERSLVVPDPDHRRVTFVSTGGDHPVGTWNARSGKQVAVRELHRPHDGAVATADGDLVGLVDDGSDEDGFGVRWISTTTLRTIRTGTVPAPGTSAYATVRGSLLASAAVTEPDEDLEAVQVTNVLRGRSLNQLRFPAALTYRDFEVADVAFTPAGLLAVTVHRAEGVLRVHHWSTPRRRSADVTIRQAPDVSEVGEETVLSGRLLDAGVPVAGVTLTVVDEPWRSGGAPPRVRTVTTDSRGRWSLVHVPDRDDEILTVEYAGSRRHPEAWAQMLTGYHHW